MSNLKRATADWGITEIVQNKIITSKPVGTTIEHRLLDENTSLLHFSFTPETTQYEIAAYAASVKKLLPQHVLALFTPDSLKLEVHRMPGAANIRFTDCEFESDEQLAQFSEIINTLTKEGGKADVEFERCIIRKMVIPAKPANFVAPEIDVTNRVIKEFK
jgi:hypothetical protein